MYILAIESSIPENNISNGLLSKLNIAGERSPVSNRKSVLTADYINATGNKDVSKSLEIEQPDTTDLAIIAAKKAISNAGINAEEIGLILADTSSQLQFIPGESQRIGKELGLKIKAYDVGLSSAGIACHIDTLSSWKEDKLPHYTLSIGVHTPTRFVDFSQKDISASVLGASILGDCAVATIISNKPPKNSGKSLRLVNSTYITEPLKDSYITLPAYEHLTYDHTKFVEQAKASYELVKEYLNSQSLSEDNCHIFFPNSIIDVKSDGIICDSKDLGFSLGVTGFRDLSLRDLNKLQHKHVVIVSVGAGYSTGITHLIG